ncbi:DUF1491 family protein [Sphingomonas baiyangensis]|uniref:DUF1491 family protein n=1 Tax=Sphingomonas baiyangensis TaxID=2572576 RepID=A0A4U1L6R0_9SPHN|nr:DUF1491 family protein [Sphingomonas baiyangensis]TKD51916.1 DUF1491 family protein [Sphingomonas baiyangensis]
MTRLSTATRVSALLRRVHAAGGSAMVLARGDAMGGGILVQLVERGADARFVERGIGADGETVLIATGPSDADSQAVDAYWQRRRSYDPDLWVIELDVPDGERFAAETILDA